MRIATTNLLAVGVAVAALLAAGCEGSEGTTGAAGTDGAAGISCWDLNENGACDADTEDTDGDGECSVTDCAGAEGDPGKDGKDGDPGKDGEAGKDGTAGTDGAAGISCWDLDGNGACDAATEDIDGDGSCTAADCAGPMGEKGDTGSGFEPPSYVGSAKCGECHAAEYAEHMNSGHPYKLTKVVDGKKVERPFDNVTGGVPDPADIPGFDPALSWNDVSYVIGGFGWKARYVGTDGYIITGAADTGTTQWNFPKDFGNGITFDEKWVAYNAGKQKAYNCGSCHTTGWVPCPDGAAADDPCRQDGLPGMAGNFFAGGVQCEACHGPGSQHAEHPNFVEAKVDRSPELCGECHIRDAVESVNAKGGFIKHHEQYEELFASKKHSMRCIDCHDPHKSVLYSDADLEEAPAEPINPDGGIRISCTTCHVGFDSNQKSNYMQNNLACVDCHMPRIVKSAQGDAAQYSGDIRTHFFHINTAEGMSQFTADGSEAEPFVTLDFSCKVCHRADGSASDKTDAELSTHAMGYHGQ